ncbi:MAG: hypothetical protein AB7G68_07190 [Nitrospiraceae bacterium]
MHHLKTTLTIAATLSTAVVVSAYGEGIHYQAFTVSDPAHGGLVAQAVKDDGEQQLLQGNLAVLGKVEAVTSDQIKVDIGEVQPRFLPLSQAKEKGFPDIKAGDNLVITVNGQNLIVDYHPLDDPSSSHHKVVRGKIADNMPIGHDKVVIKEENGKESSFTVRSQARSKIASIPVGTPALFLIDETNQVSDGTFASLEAVKEAHKQFENKSPIKGANRQVDGTVVEPLHTNKITIKTGEGERPFEVREVMQDRISKLQKGESVILLVDNENKVVDIAVPPQKER